MATSTLTSKGQITIPVKVREALGIDTGDRVEFIELRKGEFAIVPATNSVRELKGFVSKARMPVSIHDMNLAIARQGAAVRKTGAHEL